MNKVSEGLSCKQNWLDIEEQGGDNRVVVVFNLLKKISQLHLLRLLYVAYSRCSPPTPRPPVLCYVHQLILCPSNNLLLILVRIYVALINFFSLGYLLNRYYERDWALLNWWADHLVVAALCAGAFVLRVLALWAGWKEVSALGSAWQWPLRLTGTSVCCWRSSIFFLWGEDRKSLI